ncbi:MAG: calcium/sodium antiporter [Candidatus Cloacimonetes bacterium]|nr:calcium/sodium antiporter [Candidatus Cloacimonadota bacterium]MBT6994300.1 calcium/sodium antiporter [Candidatus Cloacimonadota bacterium]MBT7468894.1 calcium/sodium antiporter [Candidatus Cloacimonadota bacterium]
MILDVLYLVVGFLMLIKGADFLVDGSSSLAKKLRISEFAIGITIVAFGTSAPELVVNIFASISGHHEITFGNILGSNIFNILMALGVSGIIAPLIVKKLSVKKEIVMLMFATVVAFLFVFWDNELSTFDGILMLIFITLFFVYIFGILRTNPLNGEEVKIFSMKTTVFMVLIGMLGLFWGGKLVVNNSISIAQHFNVSEKLIALTIVAFATSLPELITSVMATKKQRFGIAIGNVVGSNIFNLLLVLGVSATISPIKYNPDLNIDFIFLIVITLILGISLLFKKHKISKVEATIFICGYFVYLFYIIYRK